jgi:hypothetical protein
VGESERILDDANLDRVEAIVASGDAPVEFRSWGLGANEF